MTVHVACAVRGAYVPHSAALLHSVVERTGGDAVVHYLHGPDLGRRDRRRLARLGDVRFRPVDPRRLAGLPVRGHFTEAMWYRAFLPELVDAPRVLYLDVDTIAAADLRELAERDLAGHALGAVANVRLDWMPDRAAELGVERYFNSGVLWLDLDELRRGDAAEALLRTAREGGEALLLPDQDALNLVFDGRWLALEPRWNAMNAVLGAPEGEALFGAEAVRDARERPAIRHFEGPGANKPWAPGFAHPHGELYWRHRQATAFRRRRGPLTR